MNESDNPGDATTGDPRVAAAWQSIGPVDRRILGVLIEKAKTTPDAYPLTLNALKNGCNQKSNRFPQMNLGEADVEDAVERLRALKAVVVIQGGARVDKFRHLAYDWLGVDKVEIAVMAELLLRGAQTVGELRGRAARMEPIPDLAQLRPVLDRLVAKKLIVYLTPAGRGATVTHTLYSDREMERLRHEYDGAPGTGRGTPASSSAGDCSPPAGAGSPSVAASPFLMPAAAAASGIDDLSAEVKSLRHELATLRAELGEVRDEARASIEALRSGLESLKRSLGEV